MIVYAYVCLHILVKKISKSSKNMRFSYSFHYEISEKYPLMHLQNMFYQIFLLRSSKINEKKTYFYISL